MAWGDRAETIAVSIASGTTGDQTLYNPPGVRKFAVFYVFLQNTDASNASTLIFKSGSTALSGPLVLNAASGDDSILSRLELRGTDPPLFIAEDTDDNLVLNKTGSGTVHGWVIVGDSRSSG